MELQPIYDTCYSDMGVVYTKFSKFLWYNPDIPTGKILCECSFSESTQVRILLQGCVTALSLKWFMIFAEPGFVNK